MNNNPQVQIIINCYNGQKYLHKSINSVLSQSYHNWQIIFFDNASTDESLNILNSFKLENKVKIFKSLETIPLGHARRKALSICNASFVTFLDVDDFWEIDKLKLQLESLILTKAGMSYTGYFLLNEITGQKKTINPLYKTGYIFNFLLREFDIMLSTAMLNMNLVKLSDLNFDPNIYGSEEYDLFIQISALYIIDVIDIPLSTYLLRENSLTSQSIQHRANDKIITFNKLTKKYNKLIANYLNDYKFAFSKIHYYQTQYYMEIGDIQNAKRAIKKILFYDMRYLLIGLTIFIDKRLYFYIQKLKYSR
jgi:glycosyltransferase involved in cell wall biosynthesis